MRADGAGLKQCEKHGLNYDPRLTRGCVLCRKNPNDLGSAQNTRSFALGSLLLFGALSAFGWVYVRPLIVPASEARNSYAGLSPAAERSAPRAEPLPGTAGAGAEAAADDVPSAAEPEATPLQPLQPALWSEVARNFEPYTDDPMVQELAGAYGIHVGVPRAAVLAVEQGKLAGTRPAASDIAAALVFVKTQLERYPRALMQRIGFQQLVLVADLRQKGVAAGAFVMAPGGAMFADPRSLRDEYAFHHELFHFVDYRLHGRPPEHTAWLALNPADTRYRGGGRQLVGSSPSPSMQLTAPRRDLPGFVSGYAQAASEEDMAEVFATLMARRPLAAELVAKDPVIAAKAQFVRAALDRLAPGSSQALAL